MRCEELNIPCPKCSSKATVTYFVMDGFVKSVCRKCAGMWVLQAADESEVNK